MLAGDEHRKVGRMRDQAYGDATQPSGPNFHIRARAFYKSNGGREGGRERGATKTLSRGTNTMPEQSYIGLEKDTMTLRQRQGKFWVLLIKFLRNPKTEMHNDRWGL
jgi:hypothetical protein